MSARTRRGFSLHPFLGGGASLSGAAAASAQGHAIAASSAGASAAASSGAAHADPHAHSASSSLSSSLDGSLRWFRFHTSDLQRTLSFYMSVMKMQMDRQIDAGSRVRMGFQYPGDKVGLRFEYERYGPHASRTRDRDGVGPLPTSPTTPISLLIYVDSVVDFVSRARECGFVVYVDAVTVCADPLVRSAVLLDPAGIKVRLMEGEVYALNRLRCRARLAYVSIPVKEYASVEKSLRFYSDVFGPAAPRSSSMMAAANANTAAKGGGSTGGVGAVPNSAAASASQSGSSFRLVDMERFVEELATYVWLANGSRHKHTAVCLFHQIKRKHAPVAGPLADTTHADGAQEDDEDDFDDDGDELDHESMRAQMTLIDRKLEASEPEDAKVFLGLSFTVADIEQALSFLRTTQVGAGAAGVGASAGQGQGQAGNNGAPGSTTAAAAASAAASGPASGASNRLEVQHIPGFPRFVSFVDPSQIPLEISDGAMTLGGPGSLSSMMAAASAAAAAHSNAGGLGPGGGVGGSATAAAMLMRSNTMRAAAAATAAAALSDRSHAHRPAPMPSPSPPSKRAPSAAGGSSSSSGSTGRRPSPPVAAYSPPPDDSSRSSSPTARDEWSDDDNSDRAESPPHRLRGDARLTTGGRRSRARSDHSRGVMRMQHDDLTAPANDDGVSSDE